MRVCAPRRAGVVRRRAGRSWRLIWAGVMLEDSRMGAVPWNVESPAYTDAICFTASPWSRSRSHSVRLTALLRSSRRGSKDVGKDDGRVEELRACLPLNVTVQLV